MECPKAALFDLDDALAPPHAPISDTVAQKIKTLCDRIPIGIVSAAHYARMVRDVIRKLPAGTQISNFYFFPENGAQVRMWNNGEWLAVYSRTVSNDEKAQLSRASLKAIQETGVLADVQITGQRLIERDAGISIALLGADAPEEKRVGWDPDGKKLEILRAAIAKELPDWNVSSSRTSIYISAKHISNAASVWWLADHLHIPPASILYVGEAPKPGGNNFSMMTTGVALRETKSVAETLSIMDELLTACGVESSPAPQA